MEETGQISSCMEHMSKACFPILKLVSQRFCVCDVYQITHSFMERFEQRKHVSGGELVILQVPESLLGS
jgi:hypothetical protein